MGKYDEFDLDIKETLDNDGGGVTRYSTNACWGVSSAIVSSVVTGCTGDCLTTKCSAHCPKTRGHNGSQCQSVVTC